MTSENYYIKIGNKSFENVWFRHLGTLINENCIHEEINIRLNLGNAWYHAIQNAIFSHLSKNMKIQIYKTIIYCSFVWV
jgi:hypothetical protein